MELVPGELGSQTGALVAPFSVGSTGSGAGVGLGAQSGRALPAQPWVRSLLTHGTGLPVAHSVLRGKLRLSCMACIFIG